MVLSSPRTCVLLWHQQLTWRPTKDPERNKERVETILECYELQGKFEYYQFDKGTWKVVGNMNGLLYPRTHLMQSDWNVRKKRVCNNRSFEITGCLKQVILKYWKLFATKIELGALLEVPYKHGSVHRRVVCIEYIYTQFGTSKSIMYRIHIYTVRYIEEYCALNR